MIYRIAKNVSNDKKVVDEVEIMILYLSNKDHKEHSIYWCRLNFMALLLFV